MTIRILLNPSAGRGAGERAATRLERLATKAGLALERSSGADDLARRAERLATEGCERLIVAGGDGTWHHVARGLAGSDTALAPLPVGTGNDLARVLGYPLRDLDAAFSAALEGERARLDLGEVGGRIFCGVAGAGLGGAVAARARTRFRGLRGPWVYVWATLATLARFVPPRLTLEADGERFEGEVFLVAFANTPSFGGGMRIAPDADPADGRLDLIVVRRLGRLRLLLLFPRVYLGRHLGHPCVAHRRFAAARLAIEPAQEVAGDGEALARVGSEAVAVGVRSGALAVVRAASRPVGRGRTER